MRSFTSRNDRAKASASYTTSSGETIRMRITKPPTTSTPRPTSTCKAPNTATDKPTSSTKSKVISMMKVSKFSKRRPTTGRDSDGPLSFASTSTPHSGTSAAALSPLARPPMERVDSVDLISLQKIPEEGNIRLSDLSLSSLSQGRSPQDSNNKSHRGSTGTATTVSSDFTFSTKSLQSTGDHSACGTFRGITTTESTDGNIISSKSKFPPRRRGGSLSILRPVTSTALTAYMYDTDLDQTTRSNASCPCDLGRRNSVRFGQVEILEFQRAIGDNPSCASGGPPISLGGTKPLSSQSIGLDDYEIHRTTNRRKREEMMVPPKLREKWLRDAGYGSAQIHESIRRASIIKQQREKSTRTSTVVHELSQRFKTLGDFWKKKPHQRCGTETRKKSPSPTKDKIIEVKGTDLLGSSRRGSLVGLSYNELDQKRSVDALAA